MFIPTYGKNSLINVAHIVRVYVEPPYLEQRDYRVYASLSFGNGTVALHRGNEESCAEYLKNFAKEVQNNG